MPLEISSYVSLKGKAAVPGDLNLTLTTLAAGMLSDCEMVLSNPSPSPEVDALLNFLGRFGAKSERTPDKITFRGGQFEGDVLVDEDVPDAVLHSIVCQAVFSASSVRISEGAGRRAYIVRFISDLLETLGIPGENICTEENDTVIGGADFSPPDIVQVSSAWEFEAVVSAAASSGQQIVISYPPGAVDHICDLLTFLGFRITSAENADNEDVEITRRLSRAAGKKSSQIRTIDRPEKKGGVIDIPGDTTLAAAVCAAASLLERSNVTIEGVAWSKGKRGFFEALKRMKANIEWMPDNGRRVFASARIHVKWSKREGIHLSADQSRSMVSELLILGAVASYATGKTVIGDPPGFPGQGRDVYSLFARGLETFGAHAGDFADGIALHGMQELKGNAVDASGNSGVALALATAALKAAGTTIISGAEKDIYPLDEFLRLIRSLAAEII
jgi:3-phosphoshikimate 1-carboxyvinyltransferase